MSFGLSAPLGRLTLTGVYHLTAALIASGMSDFARSLATGGNSLAATLALALIALWLLSNLAHRATLVVEY